MQISYLITMEQALNYLSNQGLDGATSDDFENNVKIYRLAAHDKICDYLGYEIVQTDYTDERLNGDCTNKLYLNNRPITALTTLKFSDVEQTASDYDIINGKYLFIESGSFPCGDLQIKASYTAGYTQASMPTAIRLVALKLIALYQGEIGGAGTIIGKSSISDGQGGSESIDFDAESRLLESLVSYQKVW